MRIRSFARVLGFVTLGIGAVVATLAIWDMYLARDLWHRVTDN